MPPKMAICFHKQMRWEALAYSSLASLGGVVHTNVDGESIEDVYVDSINNASTSVKLSVIYKDGMDTDVLKSKIIAACESAGKPVKESSYYLATRATKTLNGESYIAATVNIDFSVSRDEAMNEISDEYKVEGDANVFDFTDADETADNVATYLMTKLDESEDSDTTLYYILDADSSTANITNKLYVNADLNNGYKLYLKIQLYRQFRIVMAHC